MTTKENTFPGNPLEERRVDGPNEAIDDGYCSRKSMAWAPPSTTWSVPGSNATLRCEY